MPPMPPPPSLRAAVVMAGASFLGNWLGSAGGGIFGRDASSQAARSMPGLVHSAPLDENEHGGTEATEAHGGERREERRWQSCLAPSTLPFLPLLHFAFGAFSSPMPHSSRFAPHT